MSCAGSVSPAYGVSIMRYAFLGGVALSVLAFAGANAADLPPRGSPYSPTPMYAPVSANSWSGFYAGINAGMAFTGSNGNGILPAGSFLTPGAFPQAALPAIGNSNGVKGSSGTFGIQAGYNWQLNNGVVIGTEADINWRGRNRSGGFGTAFVPLGGAGPFTGSNGFAYFGQNRSEWFGTLRSRVGVALDRALPYVTAGLAYGGTGTSNSAMFTTNGAMTGGPFVTQNGGSNFGWAAGAGIEYAFTNNISLKAEYLYVNIDHGTRMLVNPTNPGYLLVNRNDDRMHVLRAGLNSRFGGIGQGIFA